MINIGTLVLDVNDGTWGRVDALRNLGPWRVHVAWFTGDAHGMSSWEDTQFLKRGVWSFAGPVCLK